MRLFGFAPFFIVGSGSPLLQMHLMIQMLLKRTLRKRLKIPAFVNRYFYPLIRYLYLFYILNLIFRFVFVYDLLTNRITLPNH